MRYAGGEAPRARPVVPPPRAARPHLPRTRAHPPRTVSFESDLSRLEEIVAALEGEELTLDAALALFQEGVERLRGAAAELGRVESQVKLLVEQSDGTLTLDDFDA